MWYTLKEYNEEYYKIYARRRKVDWNRISSFRWIKETLRVAPGDVLLDAGCGDGNFLHYLCGQVGARGVGVDSSGVALKVAAAQFPRFTYCAGDLTCLPFRDASFTKVLCFNVIEHVRQQDEAMRELRRVLRPGGSIVFGTNIRDSLGWRLYQGVIGDHTHEREFTVREFLGFIQGYFTVAAWAKKSGVFRVPAWLRWVFQRFLKGDILVEARKREVNDAQ